jgi:hypothetical protein
MTITGAETRFAIERDGTPRFLGTRKRRRGIQRKLKGRSYLCWLFVATPTCGEHARRDFRSANRSGKSGKQDAEAKNEAMFHRANDSAKHSGRKAEKLHRELRFLAAVRFFSSYSVISSQEVPISAAPLVECNSVPGRPPLR